MQVKQYTYLGSSNNRQNTLNPGQTIEFTKGAYRIAFQALPGTIFRYSGENTGSENEDNHLIMGPTGIYEIGFSEPLISEFEVITVIEENSVMILDVLEQGSLDRNDNRNIISNINILDSLLEEPDYENI